RRASTSWREAAGAAEAAASASLESTASAGRHAAHAGRHSTRAKARAAATEAAHAGTALAESASAWRKAARGARREARDVRAEPACLADAAHAGRHAAAKPGGPGIVTRLPAKATLGGRTRTHRRPVALDSVKGLLHELRIDSLDRYHSDGLRRILR